MSSNERFKRKTCLWKPSEKTIADSNLVRFQNTLRNDKGHDVPQEHPDFHHWTVKHADIFWDHIWDFCSIIGDKGYTTFETASIIENAQDIQKAVFFPKATLNFAENLLRRRDAAEALVSIQEDGHRRVLSYLDVYTQTHRLIQFYDSIALQEQETVACYLPNCPEAVIGMLGTAARGAIWSTCSPDFGAPAVLDRFSQIQPRILYVCDGYVYNGKTFDILDKIIDIASHLPSLEHIIMVPILHPRHHVRFDALRNDLHNSHVTVKLHIWDHLQEDYPRAGEISFKPFPFNHPLYIAYSSGTTGVPKCIVHGAGGILIQHMKEHQLHCNIQRDDVMFYFTTCSWMMWHWLISGLASGARLILYDGSPTYPHFDHLLTLAQTERITLFGTSAKYIDALSKHDVSLKKDNTDLNTALPHLKMITSTGSPLIPSSFHYVYEHIKQDVCLASISGGTDILSCFVLGNSNLPVYEGEIQTAGLALDVDAVDEHGDSLAVGEQGELICRNAFPSRPLYFWKDKSGAKYRKSYYERFPNIWHHGDYIEKTPHYGFVIHGRSDATLNPGGVRIGTAEIYRQLADFPNIEEGLAIGQPHNGDELVLLFVKMRDGVILTEDDVQLIKSHIRTHTTPRHVPARILQVSDLPRTHNNKTAELAVKKIMRGEIIDNQDALQNPQSLKEFEALYQTLQWG